MLTDNTISLRTLINEVEYLNLLKIPPRIIPFVKKLKAMRNTLHFGTNRGRSTNFQVIDDYRFVIEYIKDKATKKHNHLIGKLGFNPAWKLP